MVAAPLAELTRRTGLASTELLLSGRWRRQARGVGAVQGSVSRRNTGSVMLLRQASPASM